MIKIINCNLIGYISLACSWGFAPNPTYFFALMQKSKQKKSRLRPLSLEKLVVCRLKTFKLASTKYVETQTEKFSTPTSLHFSAHRTRSVPCKTQSHNKIVAICTIRV